MERVTSQMVQVAWRHLYLSEVLDAQPTVVQCVQQRGQCKHFYHPQTKLQEGNVFTPVF